MTLCFRLVLHLARRPPATRRFFAANLSIRTAPTCLFSLLMIIERYGRLLFCDDSYCFVALSAAPSFVRKMRGPMSLKFRVLDN